MNNLMIEFVLKNQKEWPTLCTTGYGFIDTIISSFLGFGNEYSFIGGELVASNNNNEDDGIIGNIGYDQNINDIAPDRDWGIIESSFSINKIADKSMISHPNGCHYSVIFTAPSTIKLDLFAGMLYVVAQYDGDFQHRNQFGKNRPLDMKLIGAFKRFLALLFETSFKDRIEEVQNSIDEIDVAFNEQLDRLKNVDDFFETVISYIETNLDSPVIQKLRDAGDRSREARNLLYLLV